MDTTTRSGKVLPIPSVDQPIIDDGVQIEAKIKEEHPVEYDKLENNKVPSN